MIGKFIQLQIKSFFRSTSMKFNLAIKIILGIGIIFYSIMILFLGVAAFYGLQEAGYEPMETVNRYLIYWWLFDLVFRYILQKMPIMWVRPLLSLPIRRKTITNYLLGKSAVSFFNFYPALFFIPFSVTLLMNGYSVLGVITWNIAAMSITYFNNYLNLLVNNKNSVFAVVALLLVTLVGLQYFQILDITIYTLPIFYGFYSQLWTFIIPLVLLLIIYRINYRFYSRSMYLDAAVQSKSKRGETTEYTWLDRFGLMGTFLKNDLRLILRNKRAKKVTIMSFVFLLYGLLFYTNPHYRDSVFWLVFAGVFIPSGFLFTFGGLVPSWDSSHYPLMMTQNIKYREYITSKWWLMVIATLISMVISAFYLYFGTRFYLAILAGGFFSIGVNSHLTLWAGAYVKTPIDLEAGRTPFGNTKAFNGRTLLLSLPKIGLPFVIFLPFYYYFNSTTIGFIALSIFGLLGLLFRNKVFGIIEKTYKKEKYDTLSAYKQNE